MNNRETEKQFFQHVKCPHCNNSRGIWRRKSSIGKTVATTCATCFKKFDAKVKR